MDVDTSTITNWELGRTEPALEHWPAIIRFLGFVPLPCPNTFPERIRAYRLITGHSMKSLGGKIGVDPATVAGWESGQRNPFEGLQARAEREIGPTLASCSWE